MSIKEGFLVEIERESANTKRLLESIGEADLNYKPHEKSMTLGQLAGHIVELHNWFRLVLESNEFDLQTSYSPLIPSSTVQLMEILENGLIENKKSIETMDDSNWSEIWKMKAGDYVIAEVPKIGAVRFIVQNHLIHHRGQLTVYLRLLNIPIPGLYGPSADDLGK